VAGTTLGLMTSRQVPPQTVTVFLPCHTLDDFPSWLDETEAETLLTAWTAAWHPAVIAAAGSRPGWASVDLRPPAGDAVGIVPAFCDERFAAQVEADDCDRWVRGTGEAGQLAAALVGRLGLPGPGSAGQKAAGEDSADALPGATLAADFHALGLAVLLAELLARRMRSEADLAATGFDEAAVAAARAAVAGDETVAQERLREAYACLEATRARYYPVQSWVVDLVLVAPTTTAAQLDAELASPVPLGIVATAEAVRRLAERYPQSLAALREAVAAGRLEPCGGREEERPLDGLSPEEIQAGFAAGRAVWQEHLGRPPSCYAAITGGATPIVPQLLAGHGYEAAVWSLFDGSPLPDPSASRIRWEGGGSGVEAVARPPLDATTAQAVLALPDRLGDAFDHDHIAVIQFAHYAGSASRWHGFVRRIGRSSGLLGTFVTPRALVENSAGAGTLASFEPDAFAPTPPPEADAGLAIAAAVASARAAARGIWAAERSLHETLAGGATGARPLAPARASAAGGTAGSTSHRAARGPLAFFRRQRDDDARSLDNGLVRLVAHPQTGGILSLRRPADRGNRISQQLALRSTAAARPGRWLSAEERAVWTRMEADVIDRVGTGAAAAIQSRGRLVDAAGRPLGRFTQRITLVPDMPLAVLELEVSLAELPVGPLWEAHLACRFAWHENEEMELRRSLHLQSIATERSRFTASHFIEIVPQPTRTGPGGGAVTILTGGLPWHLRSSPHVVDCLLPAAAEKTATRLAVGVGLERPWEPALAFTAGERPAAGVLLPAHVRLTAGPPGLPGGAAERPGSLRVGLLESAGQAGDVRLEWARPVARAVATDLDGNPLPEVPVAVDGRVTVVFLHRYQWLQLSLEFDDHPPPAGGGQERPA
jgi:hypothetical protein